MFIVSKLLSCEMCDWFLATVLAWESPMPKVNAPHRLMNLRTLLSVAEGKVSSLIHQDVRPAILEFFESDSDRYVVFTISLMCMVFLTEVLAKRIPTVLQTPSPTTSIQQ